MERPGFAVLALAALVPLSALGCATARPPEPPPVEAPAGRSYLLDPIASYPLTVDNARELEVRNAFEEMLSGGALEDAAAVAAALLEDDPGFHPGVVLRAQVHFLRGEDRPVVEELAPVTGELPGYPAAQLLQGRAAERLGLVAEAFEAYRAVAEASPVAEEKRRELRPRALEIVHRRVAERVERAQLEEAERELERLGRWAPQHDLTLDARRLVLAARGDVEAELEVVRRLVERRPESREIAERLAELEVEAGDLGAGLRYFERLVEEHPADAGLRAELERAKFLWRLELLPSPVRELTAARELTRGDLATLLYWLVPDLRHAPLRDPPIATDILDHPRQDEIVRVLDLGLMRVDETLHHFRPDRTLRRRTALAALLRLVEHSQEGHGDVACLHDTLPLGVLSTHRTCSLAARCRLLPEPSDCLPEAPLSGREALELFRRALDLMAAR